VARTEGGVRFTWGGEEGGGLICKGGICARQGTGEKGHVPLNGLGKGEGGGRVKPSDAVPFADESKKKNAGVPGPAAGGGKKETARHSWVSVSNRDRTKKRKELGDRINNHVSLGEKKKKKGRNDAA